MGEGADLRPHAATAVPPARPPHPVTVAQRKPSDASSAPAAWPRPSSQGGGGRIVQRYTASPYLVDGFTERTSDGGGIVLKDKKTLYATQSLINQANLALGAVNNNRGSYVQLVTTGQVYADDPSFLRVTVSMRPNRERAQRASPYHVALAQLNALNPGHHSHADCHLTAQTVMGSDDAPAGLDNTEQPVIRTPTGEMRLLVPLSNAKVMYNQNSDAGANRAMYSFFLYAMPEFATILGRLAQQESNQTRRERHLALKLRIDDLRGQRLDKEVMSKYAGIYRAIYDSPRLSTLFARTFEVNEYANPLIGEALTQVNDEGEKIAADSGGERDLWNFHWAGVIMRDGEDFVTLENLSTESLNEKNEKWYFAMYGSGGQSFHTQASRDSHVGEHPLTMRIRTVPIVSNQGSSSGGRSKLQEMLEKNKKL